MVATAAGSKISIGTTSGNLLVDTFTEIGAVVSIGNFGRVYDEIKFSQLSNRNVLKFKGQRDDGNIEMELGKDLSDAGQAAAEVALDTDYDYNFKIELNDESSTSGSHPTYIFFQAKVMSFTTNIGSANNVVGANCMLAIKSGSIQKINAT